MSRPYLQRGWMHLWQSMSLLQPTQLLAMLLAVLVVIAIGVAILFFAMPNLIAMPLSSTGTNDHATNSSVQKMTTEIKNEQSLNASSASDVSSGSIAPGQNEHSSASSNVTISGQHYALPPNTTIHKRVTDKSGNTRVDISIRSDSQNSSHSSLQLDVTSSSVVTKNIDK